MAPPDSIASISLCESAGRPNIAPPLRVEKSTPVPSLIDFAEGAGIGTNFCTIGAIAITSATAGAAGVTYLTSDRFPMNLIKGILP